MNRKSTIAVLIAVAATTGSAFAGTTLAGDISVDDTAFTSTRTRAEVQAELAQFRQAGVNPWSTSYNPVREFRSEKTREQVTAEYQASRDSVAAITGSELRYKKGGRMLALAMPRSAWPNATRGVGVSMRSLAKSKTT